MFKRWIALGVLGLGACSPISDEPTEEEQKQQNAEAWLEAGFYAFQQGQYESACGHYHRALMMTPNSLTALLGYADAAVEWADRLLEQAMRLLIAGKNGTPDELQRSLQTLSPLIERAVRLQNAAVTYYEHVRKSFVDNRTAVLKATFGLSKVYYYRVCSPHSIYAFAEVEEKKTPDGRTYTEITDPLTREAIVTERDKAIQYLELFIKEAELQAIESRRWLAALLVSRNKPGDKERALGLLKEYLGRLEEARKSADQKIADKDKRKVFDEFFQRELRATNDSIRILEAPEENTDPRFALGLSEGSMVVVRAESDSIIATYRRMKAIAMDARNVSDEGAPTHLYDLYRASLSQDSLTSATRIVDSWPKGECRRIGEDIAGTLKVLDLEMTGACVELFKNEPTAARKIERLEAMIQSNSDAWKALEEKFGRSPDYKKGFSFHVVCLELQTGTVHQKDCSVLKRKVEEREAARRKVIGDEAAAWIRENFKDDAAGSEKAEKWLRAAAGERGVPPAPLTDKLRQAIRESQIPLMVDITRARADKFTACPSCSGK